MSKRTKRLEAESKKLAIKQREQNYCLDPANVLADVVWKYAPRNGNHLPPAACGGRHTGECCGCDFCCKA